MPRVTCSRCSAEIDVVGEGGDVCPRCTKPIVASAATVVERAGRETLRERGAARSTPAADKPRSTASPDTATIRGKQFGRFELRSLLGKGAFGQVFRAHDPQLDREVAVKIPKLGSDRGTIERFLREGKAAAKLFHPNIVPTYESGRLDGRYYIASQFVEGETLAARIAKGSVSLRDAVQWTRELAGGLAYAHEQQVIHRDVKPANIMLDRQGRPRLMDFGLAKRMTEDPSQTIDGALMGTPAYMAPEQAKGASAAVGPAADQYSLGVVLYELLAGRTPFEGSAHHQVAQHIAAEPPSPRTFRPEIPFDLQAICLKTLSKEPAARYASAAELAEDLSRWLRGEPTLARPVSAPERAVRWARRNPAIAALSVAVALALVSGTIVSAAFAYRANVVSIAEAKARSEAEAATKRAERETDRATAEAANAVAARADAEAKAETARLAEAEARKATARAEAEAAAARTAETLASEASAREAREAAAAKMAQTLAATEAASARAAEERATTEATAARIAEKEALHAFALATLDEAAAVAERGDVGEALTMYAAGADAAARSDDPELARALIANLAAWEAFCPTVAAIFDMPSNTEGAREADVVDFAAGDRLVVARSGGADVYVWNAAESSAPSRTLTHPAPVRGVACWRDAARAVTTCDDGRFRVWNLDDGQEIGGGQADINGSGNSRLVCDRSGDYFSVSFARGDYSDGRYGSFVFGVDESGGRPLFRADPAEFLIGFDPVGRLAALRRDPRAVASSILVLRKGGRWRDAVEQAIPNSLDAGDDFAFRGDGNLLVAAVAGSLSVRNLESGRIEASIPAAFGDRVAISPSGEHLAVNSSTGQATTIYGARPLAPIARISGEPRGRPTFSLDGRSFLVVSEQAGSRRYFGPRRKAACAFQGDGPAVVVKFSPDGSKVATIHGARHRTLRILNVADGSTLAERAFPSRLEDSDDADLHDVDFVADGSTVLFGYDRRLWAWRIDVSSAEPTTLPLNLNPAQGDHPRFVERSARDGSTIVAAHWASLGRTGSKLFDVRWEDGFDAAPLSVASTAVRGTLLRSYDGTTVALASERMAEVYDLVQAPGNVRNVKPRANVPRTTTGRVAVVALDPSGARLAFPSSSGRIVQHDVRSGVAIDGEMRHEGEATSVRYDLAGAHLIVGAADGSVTVCDAESGHRVGPRFSQGEPIVSLDVSDDGQWIVAGDQAGEVSVWRLPPVVASPPSDVLAYVQSRTGLKRPNDATADSGGAGVVFASRDEWIAASADAANRFEFAAPDVARKPD